MGPCDPKFHHSSAPTSSSIFVAPEPHSILRAHFPPQHTRGRSACGWDLSLCSGMSWLVYYLLLHQTFGASCCATGGPQKLSQHPHPQGAPSLRERVQIGELCGRHCDGDEHGCGHTQPPFFARPHIGQRNTPPSRCPHFSLRDEMSMFWGTQPVTSELRAEHGPDG